MATRDEKAIIEVVLKGQAADASLKDMERSARALRAQLSRLPNDSKEFAEKSKQFTEVKSRIKGINDELKGTSGIFAKLGVDAKTFGGVMMGVLGGTLLSSLLTKITGFFSNIVKGSAELSDSMADIRKTTGMTTREVERFNKALSQIDTRTASKDLRAIAVSAGQLGIAKKDLLAFTVSVDKLNVALGDEFGGGAEEVTKTVGGLRNIFTDIKSDKIDEDILKIGNAINVLGQDGMATGPVVSDFANRIGGTGIPLGLMTGQVLGLSATLQELNVNTERGGTAVVRIIQKMTTHISEFAQVANTDAKDFAALVNKDLFGAFTKVIEGAKQGGSSATALGKILDDLGVDGAGASEVINKLGSNTAMLKQKVDLASASLKNNSSILSEFNLKNNNLAADLDIIGKGFAKIFNSSFIMNGLKSITSGMREFFSETPKFVKLADAWREQKERVDGLNSSLLPLLNRHDELKAKSVLTKDEQIELRDIIDKVAAVVPLAVTEFDKYGKALDVNTEKGKLFIKMEQQKLEIMNKEALSGYREELVKVTREVGLLQQALSNRDKEGDVFRKKRVRGDGIGDKASFSMVDVKLTNEELIKLQDNLNAAKDKQMGLFATINELSGQTVKMGKDVTKSAKETKWVDPELVKKQKDAAEKALRELQKKYEDLLKDIKALEKENGLFGLTEYQKSTKQIWDAHDEMKERILSNEKLSELERARALSVLRTNTNNKLLEVEDKYLNDLEQLSKEHKDAQRQLLQTADQNELDAIIEKFDKEIEYNKQHNLDVLELLKEKERRIQEFYASKKTPAGNSTSSTETGTGKKDYSDEINQALNYYAAIESIGQAYAQSQRNERLREQNDQDMLYDRNLQREQRLLDQKVISKREYDKRISKLEQDKENRQRAFNQQEYRRTQQAARYNTIISGVEGIARIWATHAANPIAAGILTGILTTGTAVRLGLIANEKPPQFAQGGATAPGGMVNQSTLFSSASGRNFIAGEAGSEWVAPNWMLQNPITANTISMLEAMRQNRMFATGGSTSATSNSTSTKPSGGNDATNFGDLIIAINRLNEHLDGGIGVNYDLFTKVNTSIENARNGSKIS